MGDLPRLGGSYSTFQNTLLPFAHHFSHMRPQSLTQSTSVFSDCGSTAYKKFVPSTCAQSNFQKLLH
uniref:Uncharacterized protein n=1 Tax=Arundo donax TaxID=35708 RepID=A0A0A8YEU7_ARUDO